jgi:hypothetical protein
MRFFETGTLMITLPLGSNGAGWPRRERICFRVVFSLYAVTLGMQTEQ